MAIAEFISRSGNWTGLNFFGGFEAPLNSDGEALQIKLKPAHYAVAGISQFDNNLSKIHDINGFVAEEILRSKFHDLGVVVDEFGVVVDTTASEEQNGIDVYNYQFEKEGRVISITPFLDQIAGRSVADQTVIMQTYIDYLNLNIKANYIFAIESTENGAPLTLDFFGSMKAKFQKIVGAHYFLSENENFSLAKIEAISALPNLDLDENSRVSLEENAVFANDQLYELPDGVVITPTPALDGSENVQVITNDMHLRLSEKELSNLYGDINSKKQNGDPYSVAELLEARGVDLNQFAYSRTAEEIGGNIFELEVVLPGEIPSDGFLFTTDSLGNDVAGQSYSSYSDQFVLADHLNLGQLEAFDPEAVIDILVDRVATTGDGLSDFLADGASLEISLSVLNATKGFEATQAELRHAIEGGDISVDDIGKLSSEAREFYDLGVVDGQPVYKHFAVTTGGQIGSAIGGYLASYFAGDKLAVQIAASAITRSLGAEIGKSVVDGGYHFSGTNFASGVGTNLAGSIGSLVSGTIFDKLFDGSTLLGGLARNIDGAVAAEAAVALYRTIGTDTTFISAFNPANAIGGAIGGYLGTQLAMEIFDGNPQGASIGGAIGATIGAVAIYSIGTIAVVAATGTVSFVSIGAALGTVIPGLGTLVGAFIGAFIGAAMGGLFGGDPAEPEAVSLVELGFRLDAQGFFVVDGYAKDGGSSEVARNIGQSGADALNAFLSVVGGRALDFNKTLGFGYVGSKYIGTGGKRYGSVEALLNAEVTNVFKEIQIEGGDLYMKRALANTAATNVDELSDDLGIAIRYGQYMDNQVLFLEELADWEQDEWAATLLRAEETLNLDDVHASDTYTRDGNFGFEIYVERREWVSSSEFIATRDGGEGYYQDAWKAVSSWQAAGAHRELNIDGKDTLIIELGIYSDQLNFKLSGDDLTITVLNPIPPVGSAADYTETFLIRDWIITWNQFDTLRFLSGQEFDVASILALENGQQIDLTAVATDVFSSAVAPVFYEQTVESPGVLVDGTVAADTLNGSADSEDTLMGGGGDDVYSFGSDHGDDLIFDTRWDLETETKSVEYWGRTGQSKGYQQVTYWNDEYGQHQTVTGQIYSGDVDVENVTNADFTSYVEKDAGVADKVLFEAGVLEEHVSFSLIGNDLIVTVGNSIDEETSILTIRDWGEEKNRIESFEFTEAGQGPISVDDVLTLLAQGGGDNSIFALDLGRNGLELVSQEDSGVLFDMDNDGFKEQTGWVAGTDGILVLDRNNDGKINDIGEMFSAYYDHTGLNGAAPSLSSLDTNSDGVFNSLDTEFDNVRVWTDLNQDGVTDIGELKGLHRHGITEIDLEGAYGSRFMGGNEVVAYSELTQIGETTDATGAAYGVYLDYGHGMRLDETIDGISAGWSRFEFEGKDNVLFTNDDYNYQGETLVMTAALGSFVTGGFAGDTLSVDAAETQGFMINGDEGNDHITGGVGNDTLTGGAGADTLLGGDGDDLLNIDADDLATGQIDAGAGDDLILFEGDTDLNEDISVYNTEGFVGGEGNDVLYTSQAGDVALSGGAGDDTLTGGSGDDQLIGEVGDDSLLGNAGNDVLQGGEGSDTLTGGAGDDTLYIDAEDSLANIDAGADTDTIIILITQYLPL